MGGPEWPPPSPGRGDTIGAGGFRFACTRCGKCCTSAPTLTIEEGLRLGDIFVLSARIRFELFADGTPSVRYRDLGGDEGGIPIHVSLVMTAINWTTGCPAVRDKTCVIYERRPVVCRVVPLNLYVDESLVGEVPRLGPGDAERHGLECDFGPEAPVIADDGGIKAADMRAAYLEGRRQLADGIACLRALPFHVISHAWRCHVVDKTPTHLNCLEILRSIVAEGRLDVEAARELLKRQLALIEHWLTLNEGQEDSAWRQTLMRAFKKDYQAALTTS